MAQKKIPSKQAATKSRVKKGKQPTQRTPMQRVLVVGPTGKRRFEWRAW
jgi:hypothetical protein